MILFTPAHFSAQGGHLDCLQVSGRMYEWVGGWMCAVSVISACSSLKRVYRIATITAIMFLVLGSKSSCITPLPTHTHTAHTHTTHTHTHTPPTHTPTHSCSWTLATAWSTRTGRTRSRWIGPMLCVRISVSAIS